MRNSFFQSSSSNMLESSEQKQRAEISSNQEQSLANRSEDRFGKWLVPRTWMLPSLRDNSDKMMSKMTDSSVLSYSDSEHKLEISLSQDGVLVITVPKEKKIQEIKNERNIAVEHKNTKAAENINVERKSSAGSVDRERKLSSGSSASERKISTGSMERKSSIEKKSSMERKSSFSGSSTLGSEKSKKTTSMVPMNLRESFFDDPFFQDNW